MPSAAAVADTAPMTRPADDLRLVDVADVDPNPTNPRRHVDAGKRAELEASIREKGILQPLLLRRLPTGRLQVVAGSQRFDCARAVGLSTIPALIKSLTDTEALEEAAIENIQRKDMHPLDEARAFASLQAADRRVYTVAKIASRFGLTESQVYRRLRLLELEAPLLAALEEDRLSLGHAEKLCRLPATLRKAAAHPDNGVVWRRNPLLEYGTTWTPSREDLRPLNELEDFIRTKSRFDPTAPDTLHFQPALAEQVVDAAVRESRDRLDAGTPVGVEVIEQVVSTLVELSDDPMARMRLKAGKGDRIPLTPSAWREVTSEKSRCPYTVRGVITHGKTAGRVLDVCTAKTKCTKHFPPAKKTRATGTAAPDRGAAERARVREQQERERREAERAAWEAVRPYALKAFAAHVAGVKFSAALVRECLASWNLDLVAREFGIALTDKNAAQYLVLASVVEDAGEHSGRDRFLAAVKPWKFDLRPIEKRVAAEAARVPANTPASLTGIDAVVWHAMGHHDGGHGRFRAALRKPIANESLDALIRQELGTGGYGDADLRYETKNGQLHIAKPMRAKLTVGKVRAVIRRLFTPAAAHAKKGGK